MPSEDSNHLKTSRRIAYNFVSLHEEGGFFLLEAYITLLGVFALVALSPITFTYFGAVFIPTFSAIAVVLIFGYLTSFVRFQPRYTLFLAQQAADCKPDKKDPGLRRPRVFFERHMKAMKRIGTELVGGPVADVLRAALGDKAPTHLTFTQLSYAIELQLVDDAMGLQNVEGNGVPSIIEPFREYAQTLEGKLSGEELSPNAWRSFLVNQYSDVPLQIKAVAMEQRPRTIGSLIRANSDLIKVLLFAAAVIIWLWFGAHVPLP